MPKPKTYFHDRLILLILSINTFLAIALILYSIFGLGSSNGIYYRQFRDITQFGEYEAGTAKDILAFSFFAVILYAFQLYASVKIYHIRKHLSLMILLLSMVIYVFAIIVLQLLLEPR